MINLDGMRAFQTAGLENHLARRLNTAIVGSKIGRIFHDGTHCVDGKQLIKKKSCLTWFYPFSYLTPSSSLFTNQTIVNTSNASVEPYSTQLQFIYAPNAPKSRKLISQRFPTQSLSRTKPDPRTRLIHRTTLTNATAPISNGRRPFPRPQRTGGKG